MKAVILAAGKGTRLRELTKEQPKPMVPVAGKPCLERIIEGLQRAGVQEFVIVTGYMAHVIKEHFGDGAGMGARITYVHQEAVTGTGSALHLTQDAIGDSPFVMTYGDILIPSENYLGMTQAFARLGCHALLGLNWVDDPYKGAAVYLADDGRVERIEEKPPQGTATTHWNNAGVYVFDPAIYQHTANLKPSARGEYELPDAIGSMMRSGLAVHGYQLTGYWRDIGTLDDVIAAHELFKPTSK